MLNLLLQPVRRNPARGSGGGSSRRSVEDWRERFFEPWAQMRVLRRQFQRLTQMRQILVTLETGLIRGDLEQHTARRTEIDRPEIVPVDDRRDLGARFKQRLADRQLGGAIFDGKG